MSYGFRVCFKITDEGSLTSDAEAIPFAVEGIPLKLSSGTAGANIGQVDRFSVSGGDFATSQLATAMAEKVRVALLHRAITRRRGIDLGQQSLRSFHMSDYGKEYIARMLKVHAVQEDHLGITIFRDDPKPKFVRLNASAIVSSPAQDLVDHLTSSIGRSRPSSAKAEVAAGLYAITHFQGRAPARFLLLFVSIEALLEPAPRSQGAQAHVQSLIQATQSADIPPDERNSIVSAISSLTSKSIGQAGRDAAAALLMGQTYEGLDPASFFSRVYRMRNDIVHRGEIRPEEVHSVLGEMDRFVSDLISHHFTSVANQGTDVLKIP